MVDSASHTHTYIYASLLERARAADKSSGGPAAKREPQGLAREKQGRVTGGQRRADDGAEGRASFSTLVDGQQMCTGKAVEAKRPQTPLQLSVVRVAQKHRAVLAAYTIGRTRDSHARFQRKPFSLCLNSNEGCAGRCAHPQRGGRCGGRRRGADLVCFVSQLDRAARGRRVNPNSAERGLVGER